MSSTTMAAAITPCVAAVRCQQPLPVIATRQAQPRSLAAVSSLAQPATVLSFRLPQQRPQRLQRRAVSAAAGSSEGGSPSAAPAAASATSSSSSSSGRHAFLHDFCMCIPYGFLLLAGGLAAKIFGWGQPAVVMMVVGALQVVLSNLSLKAWRAGKQAAVLTLSEAGLAGWLAYYAYRAVQQGVSSLVMGVLLGLSAAMALFLLYNVAAGGNPPRRGHHGAAAAAEPAVASS